MDSNKKFNIFAMGAAGLAMAGIVALAVSSCEREEDRRDAGLKCAQEGVSAVFNWHQETCTPVDPEAKPIELSEDMHAAAIDCFSHRGKMLFDVETGLCLQAI